MLGELLGTNRTHNLLSFLVDMLYPLVIALDVHRRSKCDMTINLMENYLVGGEIINSSFIFSNSPSISTCPSQTATDELDSEN